jgi:hypothetical protein
LGGITVIISSTKGTLGARATIAVHLIGNPTVDILEIYYLCFVFLVRKVCGSDQLLRSGEVWRLIFF